MESLITPDELERTVRHRFGSLWAIRVPFALLPWFLAPAFLFPPCGSSSWLPRARANCPYPRPEATRLTSPEGQDGNRAQRPNARERRLSASQKLAMVARELTHATKAMSATA